MKPRTMGRCALLLCLCLPGTGLAAGQSDAGAAAQLTARLAQAHSVQADFVQTKSLRALKRPLKTSGRLVFVRGQGVLWRIEKPYEASYLLGRDSIVEVAADGSRRVRSIAEVPALAHVGNVFQAIFQGDIPALEMHFEVHAEANAAAFRVELTPKPALARFLKGITAKGGRFLDSIDIEEAGGDRIVIEFRDTRLDAALADADRDLFHR